MPHALTRPVVSLPGSHLIRSLVRLSELRAEALRDNAPAANALLLQQAASALRQLRIEFMRTMEAIERRGGKDPEFAELTSGKCIEFLEHLDHLIECTESLSSTLTTAAE